MEAAVYRREIINFISSCFYAIPLKRTASKGGKADFFKEQAEPFFFLDGSGRRAVGCCTMSGRPCFWKGPENVLLRSSYEERDGRIFQVGGLRSPILVHQEKILRIQEVEGFPCPAFVPEERKQFLHPLLAQRCR